MKPGSLKLAIEDESASIFPASAGEIVSLNLAIPAVSGNLFINCLHDVSTMWSRCQPHFYMCGHCPLLSSALITERHPAGCLPSGVSLDV